MAQGLKRTRHSAPRSLSRSRSNRELSQSAVEGPWFTVFPNSVWAAFAAVLGVAFLWAYWPTLGELVHAWNTQPDYSHGYFVIPVALFFLWVRRDKFSAEQMSPAVKSGLAVIALGAAVRILGGWIFVGALDGWSILPWAAGVCLLFGGWPFFKWTLPSVLFLFFMIPLPFRAETALSFPLQQIATKVSCWSLLVLGQPALENGNAILLGEHRLAVDQACSGLRIFVGIVALAFAYVIVVRRPLWAKAFLILSVLPIALAANGTRIVVTGLLYQYSSSEAVHTFSHDMAGWLMLPFAAALFGAVLWYMDQLFKEVHLVSVRELIRRKDKDI